MRLARHSESLRERESEIQWFWIQKESEIRRPKELETGVGGSVVECGYDNENAF